MNGGTLTKICLSFCPSISQSVCLFWPCVHIWYVYSSGLMLTADIINIIIIIHYHLVILNLWPPPRFHNPILFGNEIAETLGLQESVTHARSKLTHTFITDQRHLQHSGHQRLLFCQHVAHLVHLTLKDWRNGSGNNQQFWTCQATWKHNIRLLNKI